MKMLILLTLFSFSSFAAELCDEPSKSFEMPADIVAAIDATSLLWWSVSPSQYNQAPCKTHEVPEYDWWLENHGGDRRRDRRVKGFEFKDQPEELLNAFRDITRNMPDRRSSCTTILCAVDEIWGPQVGRKILYVRARHGFNTSELAFNNTRRLSSSELDDIIITLGDLPPDMEKIGRGGNQRMTLEAPGVVSPVNPQASADSTIKFFDRWRSSPDAFGRRYGLFHEFGHNVSEIRGNLDGTREWRAMTSCQVSTYGNTDNREDFTESFVMYRFNGRGLQQKCPEKYAFLKQRAFQGREYLDESQCY
jgi:hypothetical protein